MLLTLRRPVSMAEIDARGIEIGLKAEPGAGYSIQAGYILQTATGGRAVPERANSPTHGLRAAVSAVLPGGFTLAGNVVYDHSRVAIPMATSPESTDAFWVTDLALTGTVLERFRVSLVAENVFDAAYRHPAPVSVRQASVPQYGRVFRLSVVVR